AVDRPGAEGTDRLDEGTPARRREGRVAPVRGRREGGRAELQGEGGRAVDPERAGRGEASEGGREPAAGGDHRREQRLPAHAELGVPDGDAAEREGRAAAAVD